MKIWEDKIQANSQIDQTSIRQESFGSVYDQYQSKHVSYLSVI